MAANGLNPNATVEVLYPAQAIVGEGPFFEEDTGTLLWVDIYKKTINFLDPVSGTNRFLEFAAETVSAVIPVEGSSKLVALLDRKICLVDRSSGEVTDILACVEEDTPLNRFNDAKCDSSGRLWCGTMPTVSSPAGQEKLPAGFYSYSDGEVKKHSDAILSNGIGWNLADDQLYHIDSLLYKVFSYAYNRLNGSVSNQEVLIDYKQDKDLGLPDGMCTDTKGRLWVASFGSTPGQTGQRVTCWDPQTKERLMTLKIPGAKRVTSCCFGGPNYEWLFVTSATFGASEEELAEYPNSGAVFVVKDLGACGFPANKFKVTIKPNV